MEKAAKPNPVEAYLASLEAGHQRFLRYTLLVLIVTLTFEGLLRKLQIPGTSIPIFLLKDVIILVMGFQILRMRKPYAMDFFWTGYIALIILFLPVIIWTALHDPILAVFGAKQYLLYPIVGLAVFYGFHDASIEEITRIFRWLALLIIPTTIISLVQLRLPPEHWLNLAVEGNTLDNFSAGGKLRVSSTFSFVAQYCGFLNAEVMIMMIGLHRMDDLKVVWKIIYLSLVPLFIISCYVTGSRGAVIGAITIIVIATVLSLMKFQVKSMLRIGVVVVAAIMIIAVAPFLFPDEFSAYAERERGHLVGYSGEVQDRMTGALFGWTKDALSVPILGNGIGLMSNGSDLISDYADSYRSRGIWTETDMATTLYEGGIYLIIVWYGFRFFIIFATARRFLSDVTEENSLPGAFAQALVILLGFTATLGFQPPLAIWWWLAVGTSLVFWWKSVKPREEDPKNPRTSLAKQMEERKPRGQSAYAEKLHQRQP